VTEQLQLLPSSPPTVCKDSLPLAELVGFEHARPTRELIELIAELGVLEPIVVVTGSDARFQIVEGRRRSKAVQLLAEDGRWPQPARIDALVLSGSGVERAEARDGLTLALHAVRSASPASELAAIETILSGRGAEPVADTVKEIARQTGMPVQTVHRRLRLRRLSPGLRHAFDVGEITATVAEAAARLTAEQQMALERALVDGTRLTARAIQELTRQQAHAAAAELPSGLFLAGEADWRVTVLGHLRAAREALPVGHRDSALAHAIGAAFEHAELASHPRSRPKST
jgi:ParB-like chromosome segregation protein Spo0J